MNSSNTMIGAQTNGIHRLCKAAWSGIRSLVSAPPRAGYPALKAHLVISTAQNTVNAIPLLRKEFCGARPLIVSSAYARGRHWTANLVYVLRCHGLEPLELNVSGVEHDDAKFVAFLLDALKPYGSVCFNISGGKKSQYLPVLRVYLARNNPADRLAYMDSNPFLLRVYKGFRLVEEHAPEHILNLEEILNLYGFTGKRSPAQETADGLDGDGQLIDRETFALINRYYLEDPLFAKLIYKYFDRRRSDIEEKSSIKDKIVQVVNEHRPSLSECRSTVDTSVKDRYDEVALVVKKLKDKLRHNREKISLEELYGLWNKLSAIPEADTIFNQYWGSIKTSLVSLVKDSVELDDPVMFSDPGEIRCLMEICNSITGKGLPVPELISHSDLHTLLELKVKDGFLFEGMAASLFEDAIRSLDPGLLKHLHRNVRVYSLGYGEDGAARLQNKNHDQIESEHDLVYVTRFGTLQCFECKTFGHTGDIAKAKCYSSREQGGVFSQTVLITHVQSSHLEKESEVSGFIPSKVIAQLESVQRYNVRVWYFDQIRDNLLGLLGQKKTGPSPEAKEPVRPTLR